MLTTNLSFGQGNDRYGGGAYTASSGYMRANALGLDFIYSNPALIQQSEYALGVDIGAIYRYGIDDLNTVSLGGFYGRKSDGFGIILHSFGNEFYNEQFMALKYARKLFRNFKAGIGLNLHRYIITEFENGIGVSFDLGISTRVTSQVELSASAYNPNSTLIGGGQVPSILAIGVLYTPSDKVRLGAELEKMIDNPMTLKLAAHYCPIERLAFRIGTDLNRNTFTIGLIYTPGALSFGGSFGANNEIGNTPSVNFSYLKKKGSDIK